LRELRCKRGKILCERVTQKRKKEKSQNYAKTEVGSPPAQKKEGPESYFYKELSKGRVLQKKKDADAEEGKKKIKTTKNHKPQPKKKPKKHQKKIADSVKEKVRSTQHLERGGGEKSTGQDSED